MSVSHLYFSFTPLFLLSLIFGLYSTHPQCKNGTVTLTSNTIFKLVPLCYSLVFVYFDIRAAIDLKGSKIASHYGNTFSLILMSLNIVGQIFLLLVIYGQSLFMNKRIKQIFEKLEQVDSILKKFDPSVDYGKGYWLQIKLIMPLILAIIGLSFWKYQINIKLSIILSSDNMWFVFLFPSIPIALMECQYSLIIHTIYRRITIVNEVLCELSSLSFRSFVIELRGVSEKVGMACYTDLKTVEEMMRVHDLLCDISFLTADYYNLQILVNLGLKFINNIFSIFYIYYSYVIIGDSASALVWGLWTLVTWYEVLLVAVSCQLASSSAKLVGVNIHKVIMSSRETSICNKLMVFSHQVLHRPLEFSAMNIVTIDATLIFMFMESASTYLLIMLQFQEDPQSTCIID